MKTKHKILAFVVLSLLLVSSNLLAGNFDLNVKDDTFSVLLAAFLIIDVLLGCLLIFGKVKWIRKKRRSYDYLKTHYL